MEINTIVIGSDHAGFELKKNLIKKISKSNAIKIIDVGCNSVKSCDYPDFGKKVSEKVLEEMCFGIAICGSGIGISMVCNKIRGIRAALCCNARMAELARKHNDANVICLGARLISEQEAQTAVKTFLETEFEGGRHAGRVKKIMRLE